MPSRLQIALDIETCPLPTSTPAQRERLASEIQYRERRGPETEIDRSLICATHGMLGWICCASLAVSGRSGRRAETFTAAHPDEESALLEDLWHFIDGLLGTVQWITFNGKGFDVPFLQMRSVARAVHATKCGLNNTYPYAHTPHADLMKLWPQHYTLGQLCAHLGVPSPKQDVDGSDVAALVEAGKIGAVARYCEADATATLQCWEKLQALVRYL